MIGLITTRGGQEYRIPEFVILNLILDQKRFHLEAAGYIYSSQKLTEGIEYEFVVSEFYEASELNPTGPDSKEIDAEFEKVYYSEESQWQNKLQNFRRLEAILKQEGLI